MEGGFAAFKRELPVALHSKYLLHEAEKENSVTSSIIFGLCNLREWPRTAQSRDCDKVISKSLKN